jgi:hypothetical protein
LQEYVITPQAHGVYKKHLNRNRAGLLTLLAYALTHRHSRAWVEPLARLLESEVGDA